MKMFKNLFCRHDWFHGYDSLQIDAKNRRLQRELTSMILADIELEPHKQKIKEWQQLTEDYKRVFNE